MPPLQISASLAKPLANPWRNRILMQLHLRPMSPTQFSEAFGGPGLTTIARYFRELKEWGFLEVAEELRGGKRRGAVEKVYRAINRAHLDTPTWESLPYYLRTECSGAVLDGLLLRISEAVMAETFDAESDRHLSWKALHYDRQAWSQCVSHFDELWDWIPQLEAESANRAARSGLPLMAVTVALMAFRSPTGSPPQDAPATPQAEAYVAPPIPHFIMSPETAKALANPWRNRILMELHIRPMSPKQFLEEIGGPDLATVARYFRQLKQWGYLEVVDELRGGHRRGGIEKVYRAIRRVHFNSGIWQRLPDQMRQDCSGAVLDGLILRIDEAVRAETFDADTDRHLCWKVVSFDRQAWAECVHKLDELLTWIYQSEEEAATRPIDRHEEDIPATVSLMAFSSPRSTVDRG